VVGTGASLILFMWAPMILELWLGKGTPPEIGLALRLLAFSNAFASTSIIPSYLMFGLGHFRLAAFAGLAGGLSIALGGYFLISYIGVAGAALSRLVGLPIAVFNRMIVYQHAFGVFRWRLGFQQLAPVALAFVPAVLLLFVYSPQTAGLLDLLLSIAGVGLGVLVAFTAARALYR
jgi:O-antigen/teichoic acid export membrane protein